MKRTQGSRRSHGRWQDMGAGKMIDEKKLIKYINSMPDKCNLFRWRRADKIKSGLEALIELQPKIGGWIPCSERLPENDKYILLSFENFTVPLVGRYEGDSTGGAFYAGDDEESCISQDIIVNAWMPLPEPYTGNCQDM